MDYTVALDAFHGPLDLLLYLVRRNEVDVLDIPVARLADQFVEYLETLTALDVDAAGDFLVMAATLMEIKSRALLPADPDVPAEDAGPDPRKELVKQLLEYRRFKDAASQLDARAEAHAARLPRQPDPTGPAAGPVVRAAELWDLVAAFARLMRETQPAGPTAVLADDTPQHWYENWVRERVRAAGRLAFTDLFTPPHHRPRLIGLFLAVLELMKLGHVTADQPEAFGEVWLSAAAS